MAEDPRYPIGRYQKPDLVDAGMLTQFVEAIARLPREVRGAVDGLTDVQLNTPYREGGWSVRQVVHHLPDSHLNAYVRFKLALTESEPTIKPYNEVKWAELPDAKFGPIGVSLGLLEAIHTRWIDCLRGIPGESLQRRFLHPERGPMSLNELLALYAWHGRHHVAHIVKLRERMGW
jgi:hypothetical protein